MDDKTKNIQPEIENLNLDEIDVEELEKRLELAVAPVNELEGGCWVYWVNAQ